jgi:hypothetical protein
MENTDGHRWYVLQSLWSFNAYSCHNAPLLGQGNRVGQASSTTGHGSGWNADDNGSVIHFTYYNRARADRAPVADSDSNGRSSSDSDQGTLSDANASGQPNTGGEVSKVADHAVVVHADTRVDDGVVPNLRVGLDDRSCEDDRSGIEHDR